MIEYAHFFINQRDLQSELTRYGAEGWRLHTCEPVVIQGYLEGQGHNEVKAFVVMDRLLADDPAEPDTPEVSGIAMRG